MDYLSLIGRSTELFKKDLSAQKKIIDDTIASSRFLVIGGAGSIGQAVTKEIFKRNPNLLHVVDISENNMVELVRDIRSTLGYINGDFQTFSIDCDSLEFESLASASSYDYVFNLSALKHVRNERDPYTLMRMIMVNIFNTRKVLDIVIQQNTKKYFCVSTDKAANPVNMMGASKRIMEMFLMQESQNIDISMARFANVAFSDGSLLHGFNQRFLKKQPISAPNDVRRYFLTPQESGELCLMSGVLGGNMEIFFPKLNDDLNLITFSEIATKYLNNHGYDIFECATEQEARDRAPELIKKMKWPCYFFKSDTTGEKDVEEFFTSSEELDLTRMNSVGVIKSEPTFKNENLQTFSDGINKIRSRGNWRKQEIIDLFNILLPDFEHKETGKYLEQKM